MSENNKIEILYDIIDLASNYDEEEVLNFITDNIPGLKISFKFKDCISDALFRRKMDKFIDNANESVILDTSSSFNRFKDKINSNTEYRNKVSEYILLKINKFDTELKLSIFSRACTDFFYSNLTEHQLEEISEVLDYLNKNDLKVLKGFVETRSFGSFIPEKAYIEDVHVELYPSCARKLQIVGLLKYEGPVMLKTVSNDPNFKPIYEDDKVYDSFSITEFSKRFYKYI